MNIGGINILYYAAADTTAIAGILHLILVPNIIGRNLNSGTFFIVSGIAAIVAVGSGIAAVAPALAQDNMSMTMDENMTSMGDNMTMMGDNTTGTTMGNTTAGG
jgi:hypothetical protein